MASFSFLVFASVMTCRCRGALCSFGSQNGWGEMCSFTCKCTSLYMDTVQTALPEYFTATPSFEPIFFFSLPASEINRFALFHLSSIHPNILMHTAATQNVERWITGREVKTSLVDMLRSGRRKEGARWTMKLRYTEGDIVSRVSHWNMSKRQCLLVLWATPPFGHPASFRSDLLDFCFRQVSKRAGKSWNAFGKKSSWAWEQRLSFERVPSINRRSINSSYFKWDWVRLDNAIQSDLVKKFSHLLWLFLVQQHPEKLIEFQGP